MGNLKDIKIGINHIGSGHPVFIIAEAGVNHNGNVETAKKLVDIACEAGVDAVKFQAFKTENLILRSVEKAAYQKVTTDQEESQFEMLKKLELGAMETLTLKEYTENKGLIFLCTPFDEHSLEVLDEIGIIAYKVASTDITNLPFLKQIALKKKPVILSTGMAYMSEVQAAVEEISSINDQLILLQCTANYPVPDKEVNLKVIQTFRDQFNIQIGFSDHSKGLGASPFAVPMGVVVLEKHFTISKELKGPDHLASLSPDELKLYVKQIRKVESYLGSGIKEPTFSEIDSRKSLLKFLVAKKKIHKGDVLTAENLTAKRTGGKGVSPFEFNRIAGKKADRDYEINDLIYG